MRTTLTSRDLILFGHVSFGGSTTWKATLWHAWTVKCVVMRLHNVYAMTAAPKEGLFVAVAQNYCTVIPKELDIHW